MQHDFRQRIPQSVSTARLQRQQTKPANNVRHILQRMGSFKLEAGPKEPLPTACNSTLQRSSSEGMAFDTNRIVFS